MADLKKMFIYADKSVFVTQSQGVFNACPENIEKWQRDLPVDKTLDCTPTQFEAMHSFEEEYMEFSHTSNKGMMKSQHHFIPAVFAAKRGQRFLAEEIPMQWKRKFGQNHLHGLRGYFKVIPI